MLHVRHCGVVRNDKISVKKPLIEPKKPANLDETYQAPGVSHMTPNDSKSHIEQTLAMPSSVTIYK